MPKQKKRFDCGHKGFGTYCHTCKDLKAGKIKLKVDKGSDEQSHGESKKKFWNKPKCPFCNQTRIRKNEINAMSPIDTKEYRCTSYECGKEFNSEHVKDYEKVEV